MNHLIIILGLHLNTYNEKPQEFITYYCNLTFDEGIKLNILEERERTAYFTYRSGIEEHLRYIEDLKKSLKNAPHINTLKYFPKVEEVDKHLSMLSNFKNIVDAKLQCIPYNNYLQELSILLQEKHLVLNYLRQAYNTSSYIHYRREQLQYYRKIIGDEKYIRGHLVSNDILPLIPSAP